MYVSLPLGIWVRLFNLQGLSLSREGHRISQDEKKKIPRETAERNEVEMTSLSTDQVSS